MDWLDSPPGTAPGRCDPGAFADRQVAPDGEYLLIFAGSGTNGSAMSYVLTHAGKDPFPENRRCTHRRQRSRCCGQPRLSVFIASRDSARAIWRRKRADSASRFLARRTRFAELSGCPRPRIWHPAISDHVPRTSLQLVSQTVCEASIVTVVMKDGPATITARHDVVDRTGELQTRRSEHCSGSFRGAKRNERWSIYPIENRKPSRNPAMPPVAVDSVDGNVGQRRLRVSHAEASFRRA